MFSGAKQERMARNSTVTSGLLRTGLISMSETLANLKRERRGVEDAFNRYQHDLEAT